MKPGMRPKGKQTPKELEAAFKRLAEKARKRGNVLRVYRTPPQKRKE